MFIVSNRVFVPGSSPAAFSAEFDPGSSSLSFATAAKSGNGDWQLSAAQAEASDDQLIQALLPLFQRGRPVLVYLHGNNNTPARCFGRCARLEQLYGYEMIGFSWPSEGLLPDGQSLPKLAAGAAAGDDEAELAQVSRSNRTDDAIKNKIRRYRQAKTNAQDSVDALARFARLLGVARLYANAQPFTLAAHSLGAHLLQYALELPGAGEAVSTAHNIALLAACTRAEGHVAWLQKLQPKGQVFVTYNKGDSVLFGAFIADGEQLKLGTDPGSERLASPKVRYISFSRAKVGLGGHGYFVMDNMPAKTKALFGRLFGAAADIGPDEHPRQVYPLGCDSDGVTCYMAKPEEEPADGGGA